MTNPAAPDDRGDYLDRQFNPRLQVPTYAEHFGLWRNDGIEARQKLTGSIDLRYGTTKAEALDFFPASGVESGSAR